MPLGITHNETHEMVDMGATPAHYTAITQSMESPPPSYTADANGRASVCTVCDGYSHPGYLLNHGWTVV
jgi:hypothetical protein